MEDFIVCLFLKRLILPADGHCTADEPYFIVDECDVFSNENPDKNDSASVSKSEIQDEEEEIKTFYDEDSGYDSY